jgi:hypothetical protein
MIRGTKRKEKPDANRNLILVCDSQKLPLPKTSKKE